MYAKGTLTGDLSSVDEPVPVLPLALVAANSSRVNHSDGVVSVQGHRGVDRRQREVRSIRNFCSTVQSQTNGEKP